MDDSGAEVVLFKDIKVFLGQGKVTPRLVFLIKTDAVSDVAVLVVYQLKKEFIAFVSVRLHFVDDSLPAVHLVVYICRINIRPATG